VRIHRIAAISTAINLILLLAMLARARAMDPQNSKEKGAPEGRPLVYQITEIYRLADTRSLRIVAAVSAPIGPPICLA
jgi:hypothetical protein